LGKRKNFKTKSEKQNAQNKKGKTKKLLSEENSLLYHF